MPEIRKRTGADLKRPDLPREKVLAVVVRLLETALIRVGNTEYMRANDSYGLTTMRDRHVKIRGKTVRFEFRGKGGKHRSVDVRDGRLARIVKQCRDVPGYELFQYVDDDGERQAVGSADVNEYLREISGADFTAKDFRTWAGTLHAVTSLLECGPCEDEEEAKIRVVESVKRVAERLGNTPAICRQCYIHPYIIETYLKGELAEMLDPSKDVLGCEEIEGLSDEESAVLALLEDSLKSG